MPRPRCTHRDPDTGLRCARPQGHPEPHALDIGEVLAAARAEED